MEYSNNINNFNKNVDVCNQDAYTNYSDICNNKDKEITLYSRLKDVFNEYLLSEIQSLAAFNFIKNAFVSKNNSNINETKNVKDWIINKINNKVYANNINKYQIGCPDVCPNISTTGFINPNSFEFIKNILSNIDVITSELINLRKVNNLSGFQPYKSPDNYSDLKSKDGIGTLAHDRGEWNVFYLFLHEIKFEENCSMCPNTVNIIQKYVPRQYYHAFFSAVSPNTHIISHNGPTNKKLRVHIPLLNVEGSKIRVGDEIKYFKKGEAVVFDDSYNHESWHDGDKTRVNLIFDFWNPNLSDKEVKFFKILQLSKLKNGRKQLELLGKKANGINYFDIIEKSKNILKNDDWWIG